MLPPLCVHRAHGRFNLSPRDLFWGYRFPDRKWYTLDGHRNNVHFSNYNDAIGGLTTYPAADNSYMYDSAGAHGEPSYWYFHLSTYSVPATTAVQDFAFYFREGPRPADGFV